MAPLSNKIVNGILAVAITVLHITIITTVLSKSKLRKIRSHKYIVHLSCGILVAGRILIGFATETDWFTPVPYLHINLGIITFTLDRFLSIQFPLRYTNWRKENYVLFFLWFATVIASIGYYVTKSTEKSLQQNENKMTVFVIVTGLVIFISILSNAILFHIARKQLRGIQKIQILSETRNSEIDTNPLNTSSMSRRTMQVREIKQFYICFGFIITYVLAWSPPVVTKFAELALNIESSLMCFTWMVTFANINSLSDGFIFIALNKTLRKACTSFFCKVTVPMK
ncbi:uncharacterized protein LOC130635730 [Hydractinia symbiolongicarpus]|uniref:uncharacterized protein LOC130635730 n=1 Tax=Hydractinia symbiolongicarpus TaxID=13093 RepID=UPI00254F1967|nr:uncharacterized protein LOC130635730 [Hydractinia symbiolongicarpus]